MKTVFLAAMASLGMASCSRTVYVVRHAEQIAAHDTVMMMAGDPPLSDAGKVRAIVLRNELASKHIRHIYSTHTARAESTAEPLAEKTGLRIEYYDEIDSLVRVLKSLKGNALVVAHGNTLANIVNKLCGQAKIAGDLKNNEYDDLFIVKFKGNKLFFKQLKYGYASNP